MIVPLTKMTFVGLESERERFIRALQDVGVTHLILPKEPVEPSDLILRHVTETRKFLEKITPSEGGPKEENPEYQNIYMQREALTNQETQINADIAVLRKERLIAEPWGDYATDALKELRKNGLHVQFFRVSRKVFDTLDLKDVYHVFVRERAREVYFVTFGWDKAPFDLEEENMPPMSISEIDRAIEDKKAQIEKIREQYAVLAHQVDTLKEAEGELTNQVELQRAVYNAGADLGNRVFVLQCWSPIPESELTAKIGDEFSVHHFSEEPEEEDKVPVLLQNPSVFNSGEDLVKVYSHPNQNDFDPSPFVLYCFALFFGMIVGDAGYGAIMLGLTIFLQWKIKNKPPIAVRLIRMMFIISFAVIGFGLISASYFGVKLDPDNPLVKFSLLDMNSKEGQSQVMLLSIIIGMAHISISQAIKFVLTRKLAPLGWILAIWAGFFYVKASMGGQQASPIALYGMIAGFGVVFLFSSSSKKIVTRLTGGLQGIMDVVQVFSDVLSYLRLFALGIATVYMAQTFNMLFVDVSQSIPVVGYIIAIVVLILGHTINLMLAIMGGVIHGLRLNFLEWYRWCFEGDGVPYKAFRRIGE